jgi:membrane protease YdiL (CAAX protease family)
VGAILVGLLYYWLVVWRKNILDCIVAHGVTNLTLGIYILRTREWFWW